MKYLMSIVALVMSLATYVNAQEKPDEVVTYKTIGDVTLSLHIFNPPNHTKTDKTPAIVFFHGGGWNGGKPSAFYRQSAYLASRGMVALSVEYRIKSVHGTSPFESVKDANSAMRYVRSHAQEFGIDPDKLAAGGGSAGGHLAAATATLKGFDESSDNLDISKRPSALVLFNPAYNTSAKDDRLEKAKRRMGAKAKGYSDDEIRKLLTSFSPLHNLHKDMPPATAFLGTADKLIPVADAKAFQSKMQALGVRSDLHLYEGQPHGFFNKVKYYETLLEADKFLTSLGYLSGEPTLKNSEQS